MQLTIFYFLSLIGMISLPLLKFLFFLVSSFVVCLKKRRNSNNMAVHLCLEQITTASQREGIGHLDSCFSHFHLHISTPRLLLGGLSIASISGRVQYFHFYCITFSLGLIKFQYRAYLIATSIKFNKIIIMR